MSEATKPKWTFEMEGHRDRIYDPDGHTFAEWGTEDADSDKELEPARDQARKLVHAMNQHDGLVAALERFVDDMAHCQELYGAVAQAESALAGEPTT